MTGEKSINIEAVRIPPVRQGYGNLVSLCESIEGDGLRHPITVWTDGTLISGSRRLRAHFLLGDEHRSIQAVFVNTIEEAAKRLLADNQDEHCARPMMPSEMCRLWEVLRRLDRPAAARRADESRRRGVELRRQTQSGKRNPGRQRSRTNDYAMAVMCEPFGLSEVTATRLFRIYGIAYGRDETDARRNQAREALDSIDAGQTTIWANYARLVGGRSAPTPPRPADIPAPLEPVPAARQRQAWERSLPQMEGLVAGLAELGPPSPALTWDQIGPTHTRLMAVRRDLEKIIKKMRESNKS
jgi:hypothetical protein